MQILRRLSLTALWALAAVGLACGLVWAATAAGFIKPLIVISGSMEPGIMTGDLIVDTRVSVDDLVVGDVVSLPSELTGDLVTHRISAIVPDGTGAYTVTMKGDNNAYTDALDYSVSGEVWQPTLQLPGWGAAVMRMTTPAVAAPLFAGLLGLLGLAMLVSPGERPSRKPALA
ncbi:signal peptidase I [Microbacterium abyssi]|uniref:signal peptidase I n=1 Tax=Microbacterium abyssi TaxID=2782166 RepID=UPI001888CB7C|nr:signal peptidase I [Microbacterium sp. A18JL241]